MSEVDEVLGMKSEVGHEELESLQITGQVHSLYTYKHNCFRTHLYMSVL